MSPLDPVRPAVVGLLLVLPTGIGAGQAPARPSLPQTIDSIVEGRPAGAMLRTTAGH